jgi:hypothetical protein
MDQIRGYILDEVKTNEKIESNQIHKLERLCINQLGKKLVYVDG